MKQKTLSKDTFSLIGYAIKTVYNLKKSIIIVWSLISIISSVAPLITIKLSAVIVDKLTNGIAQTSRNQLFMLLGVFGAAYLFEQIYGVFSNFIIEVMRIHYSPYLYEKFIVKIQFLSLRTTEKAEYQDKAPQLMSTLDQIVIFIKDLINFITCMITTIGLFIITMNVKWYFGLIALAILVIRFFVSSRILKQELEFFEGFKKIRRQSGYYYNLATGGGSAKDIRMLDMQDLVLDRYVTTQKSVLEERDRISNHRNMLNAVCSALDAFFSTAVLIICAFLLFEHQLTVGTMLLMSSSILRLFGSIGSANASLSTVFEKMNDIRVQKQVGELCDQENAAALVKQTESRHEQDLAPYASDYAFDVRDMSFTYNPDSPKIIKNLNIKFEKGKVIALCGENGCGKTTLVKLLLGLYEPTDGEILFKGHPYSDLHRAQLNNSIGMAMQGYQVYPYSFRDNIGFSDIVHLDNDEMIWDAAEKGGTAELIRNSGNRGLEQNLIKWCNDDGIEPSWGQKQKLAVARAHMGNKEILILDEPASQLDPIAEYLQFMRVRELAKDTTAILISHRIGFARLADEIIVLADGAVAEQGTHDQLMKAQGKYFDMFNAQAQWYKKVDIDNYEEV